MSRNSIRILALVALTALAVNARADDTDIYLNPLSPSGGEPLVMFSLDYRANLGATACNNLTTYCGYSAEIIEALQKDGADDDGDINLYEVIRAALTNVIAQLDGVKIGFMMSHRHDANCEGPGRSQCSNGGMIMSGFKLMSASDDIYDTTLWPNDDINDTTPRLNNKAALRALLRNIPSVTAYIDAEGDTINASGVPDAHSYQVKEMYFELFRYLTGQAVYNGENGWRDFDSSTAAKATNLDKPEPADPWFEAAEGIKFYPSWDTKIIKEGGIYESPLIGGSCTRVFVINIGFGVANQDNDSDAAIKAAKGSGGLGLRFRGSNDQAQLAKFFYDVDLGDGTWGALETPLEGKQNITSYFIMQNALNTQNEWARAGGTGTAVELGGEPGVITEILSNIFQSILAVSTTFVAPSVPVNVFNRAQTLNEVYLALFEADAVPGWPGNLKKLVIGTNAFGRQELQDAQVPPVGAIDTDGRIKRNAITYWTDPAALPAASDDEVAGADGRAVKRGGAGQQIPGQTSGFPGLSNAVGPRQVFIEDFGDTYVDGLSDNLMPLDVPPPSPSGDPPTPNGVYDNLHIELSQNFSVSQEADHINEVVKLMAYIRGVKTDFKSPLDWMLGDPLHSRPLPINYGARATGFDVTNPDIRILLGTNDGFMHMFKNTDASGNQSGEEAWAFMPRAALPTINRLFTQTVADPKHPITTDGSAVALLVDGDFDGTLSSGASTLDKAIVMFGQRRGGRNLYALDVIDPDAPKLKWRIQGGTDDFTELAQTWSSVQVGKLRIDSATAALTNVVSFGGGYNGDDGGAGTFSACAKLAATEEAEARVACFAALGKDTKTRATREGRSAPLGTNDDEGNAIYIVNAETGALVWKFVAGSTGVDITKKTTFHPLLRDSIAAETALIDTSGNGISDRLYVADTGGTVWRVDLAGLFDHDSDASTDDIIVGYEPSVWQITPILTVGRHDPAHTTIADDRRFFNRIDVVQSRDGTGPFDALLIGSGDRTDPLSTNENDWFYMIKDRHTTSGRPPTSRPDSTPDSPMLLPMLATDLVDLTSNCLQTNSCATAPNLTNGWRFALAGSGEKSLAASLTSGGNVFFTTFEPSAEAGSCGLSEGRGNLYAVSLLDAKAVINFNTANDDTNEGIPEQFNYDRTDPLGSGGIPVEPVPLGGGKILVQGQEGGQNIVSTGAKTNLRTYWHER